MFADRSLKAGSLEAKAAYQPIRTHCDGNVLTVYNRLDFTNLNEYTLRYWIEADGVKRDVAETVLNAAPHTSVPVKISFEPTPSPRGATANASLLNACAEGAHTQHPLP